MDPEPGSGRRTLKNTLILIVILTMFTPFLFSLPLQKEESARHPALRVMDRFVPRLEGETIVNPYRVNLMALDLLRKKKPDRLEVVRNYIKWYLEHVNYPDKFDLTGSMYNYSVTDGKESSLNTYDNADAYTATFVLLLETYVRVSGDKAIAEQNKEKIMDLAYILPYLQESGGLTRALPKREISYLANNCEAYAAAGAMVRLSILCKWEEQKTYYLDVRQSLSDNISRQLFDWDKRNFYVSNAKDRPAFDWKTLYPDAYMQLFPILCELPMVNRSLKKRLWKQFRKYHMGKLDPSTRTPGGFPEEQKIIYRWVLARMNGKRIWRGTLVKLPKPIPFAKPTTAQIEEAAAAEELVAQGRKIPGEPVSAAEDKLKKNRIDVQYIYEYLMPHDQHGAWESWYIKYYRYQSTTFNFFVHGGMVKRVGKNDYIGLLGFARDWSPRLYTYSVVAKGTVSTYLPNARIDHDFNFKLGKRSNFILAIGATYIKYYVPAEDFILSAGLTWYVGKFVLGYRLFWNHKYPGNIESFSHLGNIEYGTDKSHWTALSASWGSQAYLALYVLVPEQVRQSAFNINLDHRQWITKGIGAFVKAGYLKLVGNYEKILLSAGLFIEFD